MPVYEYACEKCGEEFEVEQRITDDPIRSCPHCRSRKVKRLISQTSFVLKGGGWYSDLYSSSKGKEEKGEGTGKGDEKSESAKSDEKKPSADKAEKADKTGTGDKGGKGKGKGKGAKAAA